MRITEGPIWRASFFRRPNRFVVDCILDGRLVRAHLPNPGRLWELLLPGVTLCLVDRKDREGLRYTAVAVEKDGIPIMLHTHATNDVAGYLIAAAAVPGLEEYTVARREVGFGSRRFDFLLRHRDGRTIYLEIKNCTLVRGKLAMFPDAVTKRGTSHLEELTEMSKRGIGSAVLFIVQWPHARFFMPEFHTDFGFTKAFLHARDHVPIKALAVGWDQDLRLQPEIRNLAIPWGVIEDHSNDRGVYMVILRVAGDIVVKIGELGHILFKKGYYIYVGSAKKGLTQRLNRHRTTRKNHHWHIDYLRDKAQFIRALPIRTPWDRECELAQSLASVAQWPVPGFGSSDCRCPTHLFGMSEDPITNLAFIDLLYHYRMDLIEEELQE